MNPHVQNPETGAWAVEGMNSCGMESVAEDRAARMGAFTTVVRPSGGQARGCGLVAAYQPGRGRREGRPPPRLAEQTLP